MGLKASAEIKADIAARGATPAALPTGATLLVDFEAVWRPYVAVAKDADAARGVPARMIAELRRTFAPARIVFMMESAGVPAEKGAVHARRYVRELPAAEQARIVHTIASASTAPIPAGGELVKNRAVLAHLREDFIRSLGGVEGVEVVVAGDAEVTYRPGAAPASRTPARALPGEGEFKLAAWAPREAVAIAYTRDTDAILSMLLGLPPGRADGTLFLRVGDVTVDVAVLARAITAQMPLDLWTLKWLMCGTDYLKNPPKLGVKRLLAAFDAFGARALASSVRRDGPVVSLDAAAVACYITLLYKDPLVFSAKRARSGMSAADEFFVQNPAATTKDCLVSLFGDACVGEDALEYAADLAFNVSYFFAVFDPYI